MDRLLELTHHAEQSHFWFRGFRAFVRPEIERAVAGRQAPVIVDCGCGTGANLTWLARYGTTYGFDFTWNGLALGRQMQRRRLVQASIDAIPFPDACADVAVSFDVFQCLPASAETQAIAEMHRLLVPGGHVLLNVAALPVLRGRHSALSQELRRYTPGGLRRLVESAGFRVLRLTFTNAALFPLMLPLRVAQRWGSGAADVAPGEYEISVPPTPINALLSAAMRVEAATLRFVDLPVGSSLLCHAQKAAPAAR